jgi:pimeloyl-ACP methyl ester carboxylesterase
LKPAAPPRERIVRFGPGDGLAGILSLPPAPLPGAPHVVLINAGVVHRVGPNRLYVDIARRLAASGATVLRFDLSGLGDSEVVSPGATAAEAAVKDIQAALDYLQHSRQAQHFIVGGLCAGADYSMMAAFVEPRIQGTILIDPSVERTARSRLIHMSRRLAQPDTWAEILRLKHPGWKKSVHWLRGVLPKGRTPRLPESRAAVTHIERMQQRLGSYEMLYTREQVAQQLREAIDRGVHLFALFTGGVNHRYNYRNQLFDMLPGVDFRNRLDLQFMPETDHCVSDAGSRASMLRSIDDWMTKQASPAAPRGQSA